MRLIFLDPPPLVRALLSPTLWWSIVLGLVLLLIRLDFL